MTRIYLAPDEGSGAGGAAPDDAAKAAAAAAATAERTFTQADIDKMIGQRLAAKERDLATARAELEAAKAEAAKAAELATKIEALESATLSGAEKAKRDADRAAKAIENERAALLKERDEYKAKAETAERRRVEANVARSVGDALSGAKALPGVLKHAIPAFLSEVEIDKDEDGNPTAIRYAGLTKKDLPDAAAAWLADNQHFLAHAGGGSGGNRANGAGGIAADPNASAAALIAAGLREGT